MKHKIHQKQKVVEVTSSDESSMEEPSSPIMKRKKRKKTKITSSQPLCQTNLKSDFSADAGAQNSGYC